jgi:hypothetical protein
MRVNGSPESAFVGRGPYAIRIPDSATFNFLGFLRVFSPERTGRGASYMYRATPRGRERMLLMAPIRSAAMTQDVLGASWFIALIIITYGVATGQLCLWRRDN